MCAPRSGLVLMPSGQCYCQLVPAVSQPLYPFGHAGIMYTTNDISTLFWQYFNVKVNVLHIELSEKPNGHPSAAAAGVSFVGHILLRV